MNRIIKRLIGGFLATALAVTVCGCSSDKETIVPDNDNDSSVSDKNDNSEPKSVKLGIWDVLPEIDETPASEFEYEFDAELGGIVVTDYTGDALEIRIPDEFEEKPVVGIDLWDCEKELTEVILPDTVKTFDFNMQTANSIKYINHPRDKETILFNYSKEKDGWVYFFNYISLEAVYIPDNVTEIGDNAFDYCEPLTSVNIPDSVTKIGNYAFANCASLTSITVPDSVTSIGYCAFENCESLKSITIPDSVTSIGFTTFDDCNNIQATYKGNTYDYEHIDDLYNAINNG